MESQQGRGVKVDPGGALDVKSAGDEMERWRGIRFQAADFEHSLVGLEVDHEQLGPDPVGVHDTDAFEIGETVAGAGAFIGDQQCRALVPWLDPGGPACRGCVLVGVGAARNSRGR